MINQKLKLFMIAFCVSASGICYSCNRNTAAGAGDRIVLDSVTAGGISKNITSENEASGDSSFEAADGIQDGNTPDHDTQAAVQSLSEPLCYVHICGEVAAPGVYELKEGSRVFQAIELSGGFTQNAASDYLNMAETVCDGMKIVVPDKQKLDQSSAYGNPGDQGIMVKEAKKADNKVNLNTATKEQLMTLKGIGESRAEDILLYRDQHGSFKKIEDIMKVSGIKDAAFQKIKDDITV